uniref:Pre-mRNA-splicing factor CWF18 n=1 Tax=Parastrongyloides trichosuri TaxID=131310 RepID=A0A0N4ZG61_PARTI
MSTEEECLDIEETMNRISTKFDIVEKKKNENLEIFNTLCQLPAKKVEEFLKNYKKTETLHETDDDDENLVRKNAVRKIEDYYLRYKLNKNKKERIKKWHDIPVKRKNSLLLKLSKNLDNQEWNKSKNNPIKTFHILRLRDEKRNRNIDNSAEIIEKMNQTVNILTKKLDNITQKIEIYDK